MALPSLPGGTASKVADLYEAAWTVDRLLDLLADEITELHLEPAGEDGLGVEFYTVLPSGARAYHSVKRQAPASSSAWTPYQLIRATPTPGRSVLGDLFRHFDGNDRDRVVFVSQDSARDMRELTERSRTAASLEDFRRLLSVELQAAFDKVTPIAQDAADAYLKLRRTEFETVGHGQLVRSLEQRIPALVQRADGKPAEPAAVRLLLSDFAWNRLGQTTTADDVLSRLQERGFAEQPLTSSAQVCAVVGQATLPRASGVRAAQRHLPRRAAPPGGRGRHAAWRFRRGSRTGAGMRRLRVHPHRSVVGRRDV